MELMPLRPRLQEPRLLRPGHQENRHQEVRLLEPRHKLSTIIISYLLTYLPIYLFIDRYLD